MAVLRRFLGLLLLGTVALTAVGLGTGHLASVVTDGVSMLPRYEEGDLVVVARGDRYRIGEVVAYRDEGSGRVVLHRIVGGDADGFELQGDNNASLDTDRPTAGELLGRQVLHVPEVGRWIGSPLALALLAGGLLAASAALAAGAPGRRRTSSVSTVASERMSQGTAEGTSDGTSEGTSGAGPVAGSTRVPPVDVDDAHPTGRVRRWRWWHTLALVADVAVVSALVVAFVAPPRVVPPPPTPMHVGELSYAAEVPESDTYPSGRIVTGDTVFRQVIDRVDVDFRYRGDPGTAASTQLRVVLSSPFGWSATRPLTALTPVVAGEALVRGELDLSQLRGVLANVDAATGLSLTSVELRVEAVVTPDVDADAEPYLLPMRFRFDELSLDLLDEMVVTAGAAGPVVTATEPVRAEVAEPTEVGGVPREARRWLAAALLVLLAATVAMWPSGERPGRRAGSASGGPEPGRPGDGIPMSGAVDRVAPVAGPTPAESVTPVAPTDRADLVTGTRAVLAVGRVELPAGIARLQLASRDDLEALAAAAGLPLLVRDDGWCGVLTPDRLHWWSPAPEPAPPAALAAGLAPVHDPAPTSESAPDPTPDSVRRLEDLATAPRRPLFPRAGVSPARTWPDPATDRATNPATNPATGRDDPSPAIRSTIDEIVAFLAEAAPSGPPSATVPRAAPTATGRRDPTSDPRHGGPDLAS